ncbi:MAG: TlpA family protein disulfide reductase [Candidatus Omnitrophica bacterium]|nr:TlpA family protein disulfide reductase [Candidatus Omnitrophota bacterium]
MVKKTSILLIVLFLFLFSANLARAEFFWSTNKKACENIGSFSLKDIFGRELSLDEHIGTAPLLLVFWTTWCPYCRQTIKELAEIASDSENLQIKLILINVGEKESPVRRFLAQFKDNPFIILFDSQGKLSRDCRVKGIPTFVVIDKSGEVEFAGNYLPENYLKR